MPQAVESICKSDILRVHGAPLGMQMQAKRGKSETFGAPGVFTIRGAAHYLAVAPRTIHHYIRREILPAVKIGGATRIPRKAVERLIGDKA